MLGEDEGHHAPGLGDEDGVAHAVEKELFHGDEVGLDLGDEGGEVVVDGAEAIAEGGAGGGLNDPKVDDFEGFGLLGNADDRPKPQGCQTWIKAKNALGLSHGNG